MYKFKKKYSLLIGNVDKNVRGHSGIFELFLKRVFLAILYHLWISHSFLLQLKIHYQNQVCHWVTEKLK